METQKTPPEDLRPILLSLLDSGMKQAQIAREIGVSRATINVIARKSKRWAPRYAVGMRLMELKAAHDRANPERTVIGGKDHA